MVFSRVLVGFSLRKRAIHPVKGDDDHKTHGIPPMSIKECHCGSTAKHIATSTHHKQQMRQYEENIAKLQEEMKKAMEGKERTGIN